jgi:hypothetical protein
MKTAYSFRQERFENSPGIRCRGIVFKDREVPSGTAELIGSVVPDGTRSFGRIFPGIECRGYFRFIPDGIFLPPNSGFLKKLFAECFCIPF